MFLHTVPQRLPSGASPHHPGPRRDRRAPRRSVPGVGETPRGPLSRTRLPSPRNSPTRRGQGRPSSRRGSRGGRVAHGLKGPAPGPGGSEETAETRSLWCCWVTRASNCPLGTQFPLSRVWRTTRVPARTGASPAAAGSARPALGRATRRAGGLRSSSRSRSRSGTALGPSLTSDCASGFTHLTAPPTTAGRPALLALTSADPPPGSDPLQLRIEPGPRASSGSGPCWGWGERGYCGAEVRL